MQEGRLGEPVRKPHGDRPDYSRGLGAIRLYVTNTQRDALRLCMLHSGIAAETPEAATKQGCGISLLTLHTIYDILIKDISQVSVYQPPA